VAATVCVNLICHSNAARRIIGDNIETGSLIVIGDDLACSGYRIGINRREDLDILLACRATTAFMV
jgi:hypothetical protein